MKKVRNKAIFLEKIRLIKKAKRIFEKLLVADYSSARWTVTLPSLSLVAFTRILRGGFSMPRSQMRSLTSLVMVRVGGSSSSSSARLGIFMCLTTYARIMCMALGARFLGGMMSALPNGMV